MSKHILQLWCAAARLYRRHLVLYLRTMLLVVFLVMAFAMLTALIHGGIGWWFNGDSALQEMRGASGDASLIMACIFMLRWLLEVFYCDDTGLAIRQVWPLLGHHVVRYLVYVCYMIGFFALYHLLIMGMALLLDGWLGLDVYYMVISAVMLLCFIPCTYVAVILPLSVFYMLYHQFGLREVHARARDALREQGCQGVVFSIRLAMVMVHQLLMVLPLQACVSALCLVKGQWWRTCWAVAIPGALLVVACQWLLFVFGLYHGVVYMALVLPAIKLFLYGLCGAYGVALYHVVFCDLASPLSSSVPSQSDA